MKKRKCLVSTSEEEVSEEEEEEEEEKEEKEEGETDATDATGNCFVLQAINNVVATLFRAYLFLKPFLQLDPQCIPRYLAKANHWVRALLRRKNGAEVKYLLSHEQENEFSVIMHFVSVMSEQTLVCTCMMRSSTVHSTPCPNLGMLLLLITIIYICGIGNRARVDIII